MTSQANTTWTVLRVGPVDDYTGTGPEQTVAEGVPGSLIEYDRKVWDPQTGTPRTVREIKVKLPHDTDVRAEDRLVDADTGRIYPVRSVHQPRLSGWAIDQVCEVVDLSNQPPS